MTLSEARSVTENWQKTTDVSTVGEALQVLFGNGWILVPAEEHYQGEKAQHRLKQLAEEHSKQGDKFIP